MGNEEAVAKLLTVPIIDVNAKDNDGWTAVTWAAAWCRIGTLGLLLNHLAVDLDIKTNHGKGLEQMVGRDKSRCLDMIRMARRKRENSHMDQGHPSGENVLVESTEHAKNMKATLTQQYIGQIDELNEKIEDMEKKLKLDLEAKSEKVKV